MMSTEANQVLINLASQESGSRSLLASDEFFAPKENLVKPGRGKFIADKYTDRGKWMDGWETKRKRSEGYDWCIVRLGVPGVIKEIDIDTNHFVGNHPAQASVEACQVPPLSSLSYLLGENVTWTKIVAISELKGDSKNMFPINNNNSFTHVRLNIFPDGGVARLKVYGIQAQSQPVDPVLLDAAASENGGDVVACSDMHFGDMKNLIKQVSANDMGDGWETKRRRGSGHDWVILKLGTPSAVEKVVVDTLHFKGNYPDSCSIEGCFSPNADRDTIISDDIAWNEILPENKLTGHAEHIFHKELNDAGPCTHIKLNIFPDGGVSRLRIFGHPVG